MIEEEGGKIREEIGKIGEEAGKIWEEMGMIQEKIGNGARGETERRRNQGRREERDATGPRRVEEMEIERTRSQGSKETKEAVAVRKVRAKSGRNAHLWTKPQSLLRLLHRFSYYLPNEGLVKRAMSTGKMFVSTGRLSAQDDTNLEGLCYKILRNM